MKKLHSRVSELLRDLITTAAVCGTIGIALKFVVFLDKWVYFPLFPNICDSIFLVASVLWLSFLAYKKSAR